MRFASLARLLRHLRRTRPPGPVAALLVDDADEAAGSLAHLRASGFAPIVVLGAWREAWQGAAGDDTVSAPFDAHAPDAAAAAASALSGALTGRWLHVVHTGEYLFWPYAETRSAAALVGFAASERRDVVAGCVVDLYPADIAAPFDIAPGAECWFDRLGYVATPERTAPGGVSPLSDGPQGAGRVRERIDGGLRLRFAEAVPAARRRIDRPLLFRCVPGFSMTEDLRCLPEALNDRHAPWHRSVTACLASFRAARALACRPGSTGGRTDLRWPGSARFAWRAGQLCDAGLMEPGQWF